MERATTLSLAPRRRPLPDTWSAAATVIAVWAVILALVVAWGEALEPNVSLGAPPIVGSVTPQLSWGVLTAVAAAAALIFASQWAASRLSWRSLLLAAPAAAVAWTVALALLRSFDGLTEPVSWASEYLFDVPLVGSPGDFLSHFTQRIGDYNVHLRGHPPGMVLILWAMRQIGLGDAWPAAALMVLGGALIVPATLLAVREVADERLARAAAPYLILLPVAIWIGSTADAFYAGVTTWAVALAVLATGRSGRRSILLALGSGLLFGAAIYLSYGLILVALVPVPVALARRRLDVIAVAAGAGALVVLAFLAAGFWWLDGLAATRHQYLIGVASHRPYGYFLLANLAVFGLVLGPAVLAALTRLRDGRIWLLVGGGLAAVTAAELSGMSKGEVERIWLPFVPWLAIAACALPIRGRSVWLGAQAAIPIAIEIAVHTKW